MPPRYSIDIYRTDEAILIHDKPGGWKRGLPGLLLGLIGTIMTAFFMVILYFDPLPPPLIIFFFLSGWFPVFSVVLLFSLWRINGHNTFLIDRDSIRHEWWYFLGSRSRIYPRPENIRTAMCPGFFMLGGSYGAIIRISKKWWQEQNLYLPDVAERHWLFAELARFQEEVPTTQPIDEKRRTQKGSLADPESGMNVLATPD